VATNSIEVLCEEGSKEYFAEEEMKGSHRIRPSLCPKCGHTLDACTSAKFDGAQPRPGDATVCIGCGAVLSFTDDLSLQEQDLNELTPDVLREVKKVQAAIMLIRRMRN
jgi:hypothetical protein